MLPPRFLRHAPLLLVDSPARESLEQIYGAFNSALLKLHPPLRGHLDGLTNAMIDFYHLNQVDVVYTTLALGTFLASFIVRSDEVLQEPFLFFTMFFLVFSPFIALLLPRRTLYSSICRR